MTPAKRRIITVDWRKYNRKFHMQCEICVTFVRQFTRRAVVLWKRKGTFCEELSVSLQT